MDGKKVSKWMFMVSVGMATILAITAIVSRSLMIGLMAVIWGLLTYAWKVMEDIWEDMEEIQSLNEDIKQNQNDLEENIGGMKGIYGQEGTGKSSSFMDMKSEEE